MKTITRLLAALAVIFLGTAPTALASGAPSPTDGTVRVGDMAPDFTLESLTGEQICLSEGLGKHPVLLVFWSYFCFPCQKEIPDLQALQEEFGDDRLAIIGVSLDGPEYSEKLLSFVGQNGITYPNLYDRMTEEFFEVAEKYGVVGTPTSFLLDSQGRIRFVHLGRLEADLLRGLIKGADDMTYCSEITKPAPAPAPER